MTEKTNNMDVHFSSKSNEWETPQDLYDILNDEFHFKVDAAATDDNKKCDVYFTETDSALDKTWKDYGKTIWLNPPYGRGIGKFIKKAYEEALKGCTVVCLIPARTDTKFFHEYCAKGEIRFIKGRLKFVNRSFPSWNAEGNFKLTPAPFPSCIVIFREINIPGVSFITNIS